MRIVVRILTILILGVAAGASLAATIPNWPAPTTWTPSGGDVAGKTGVKAAVVTYPPMPLIPLAPCRLADTRAGSGYPAGYGPPSLPGGSQRTFTISGQCGIPVNAKAVSFNFTIWGPVTRGDLRVWPTGGAAPMVSTVNWEANILAIANAAVVPLSGGGQLTVQVDGTGTIDLIIDVNGYYSQWLSASDSQALALASIGLFTIYALNTNSAGTAIAGIATGTTGVGVYGTSTSHFGVYGHSDTSNGVRGVSSAANLAGIYGSNDNNANGSHGVGGSVSGTGTVHGVQGQNAAASGTASSGVHGINLSTEVSTSGVFGETSTSAQSSSGVRGVSVSAPNIGTSVFRDAGVRGESAAGWGVMGISNYKGITGYHTDATSGGEDAKGTVGYKPGSTAYAFYGETGDYGGTGAKYFIEPHASDPSKVIRYISLEGPESGTYFRGRAMTSGGVATIEVPDHFRMVSAEEEMTVHLTPVGRFTQIYIESANLDQIVVRSSRDVEFHYIVHGIRRAFRDFNPIDVSPEFAPETAKSTLSPGLPAEIRSRLVRIGIYNADGTVNMQTAERLGWAQKWREEEQLRQRAQQQSISRAPQGEEEAPKN